jgi:hypothetical protein
MRGNKAGMMNSKLKADIAQRQSKRSVIASAGVRVPLSAPLKLRDKYIALRDLVLKLQKERYHFPNSDHMEYCAGCGRSPYNVPQHTEECLVLEVARVLRKTI